MGAYKQKFTTKVNFLSEIDFLHNNNVIINCGLQTIANILQQIY